MCCFVSIRPYFIKCEYEALTASETLEDSQQVPDQQDQQDRQGQQCPICLEELKSMAWLQWLSFYDVATMACTHKFHRKCIVRWFRYSLDKTCPMCREIVGCRKMQNDIIFR